MRRLVVRSVRNHDPLIGRRIIHPTGAHVCQGDVLGKAEPLGDQARLFLRQRARRMVKQHIGGRLRHRVGLGRRCDRPVSHGPACGQRFVVRNVVTVVAHGRNSSRTTIDCNRQSRTHAAGPAPPLHWLAYRDVHCTGGKPVGKPLGKWRSPAVLLAAAHIHVSAQITPLEDAAMTTIAFARRQDCCGRSLAVPQSVDRDGRLPRWEGPPGPAADGFLAARSHAQCRPSGPVIQRHARRGCG